MAALRRSKYWSPVGRVDNVYGDRNLFCSCVPITDLRLSRRTMAVSVFDLFKIGIGPSSSHTVGPMRAARLFALRLQHDGRARRHARACGCELYGSLGATGKGHGSDKAVLLGLAGHEPDTVDVDAIPALLERIRDAGPPAAAGRPRGALRRDAPTWSSTAARSLPLPRQRHALRGLRRAPASRSRTACYYSVGGGFVVSDEVAADGSKHKVHRARHHRAATARSTAAPSCWR